MTNENPAAVFTDEQAARERIASWWPAAGIDEPTFPVPLSVVVYLLLRAGYDVSADLLCHYVATGVVPPGPSLTGEGWNATHIVIAAAALEFRRKWLPGKLHRMKMTAGEVAVADWKARGGVGCPFDDLDEFDVDGLLALIVRGAGNPGLVHNLVEALRWKIRQEAA